VRRADGICGKLTGRGRYGEQGWSRVNEDAEIRGGRGVLRVLHLHGEIVSRSSRRRAGDLPRAAQSQTRWESSCSRGDAPGIGRNAAGCLEIRGRISGEIGRASCRERGKAEGGGRREKENEGGLGRGLCV